MNSSKGTQKSIITSFLIDLLCLSDKDTYIYQRCIIYDLLLIIPLFSPNQPQFPMTALREIRILQLLNHENVANLVEICRAKRKYVKVIYTANNPTNYCLLVRAVVQQCFSISHFLLLSSVNLTFSQPLRTTETEGAYTSSLTFMNTTWQVYWSAKRSTSPWVRSRRSCNSSSMPSPISMATTYSTGT